MSAALLLFLPKAQAIAQSASSARLKSEAAQAEASGNTELAQTKYKDALAQDPQWLEGWWRYGGLLYEARNFQQAALAFGRLTQLAPDNSLGYAMLGVSEFELHDWNNAGLHLNKALARGGMPQGIADGAMFDYGLVLLQQRNRNGALTVFRLLQNRSPSYPDLVPAFGSAELGLQQLPPPGSADEKAAALEGKAAISVLQLRADEAERLYRQAITRYPQLPFVHLCLALFLENLGRQPEAEKELLEETKVSPDEPDAWVWLARLALSRRDGPDTVRYGEQAIKRAPGDGLPYLLLGKGYVLQQKWQDAFNALNKAESLSPESYEVHYALATVYGAMNDPASAAAERKLFVRFYSASHMPQKDGQ